MGTGKGKIKIFAVGKTFWHNGLIPGETKTLELPKIRRFVFL